MTGTPWTGFRELEENASSFPQNPRYPTAKIAKIRLEGRFVSSGNIHPDTPEPTGNEKSKPIKKHDLRQITMKDVGSAIYL